MQDARLDAVLAPEAMRQVGARMVELLCCHLDAMRERVGPVLPSLDPERVLGEVEAAVPELAEPTAERLLELVTRVLQAANKLHHPGFIGHQVAAPIPAAAAVEMVTALLNNGMAVFEMGPMHTACERRVVEFLATCVGFGEQAGGVLTHGGSAGNLTALLAARQAKAGYDVWGEGQRQPMAVLVSEQAHYCVARSAQVMGWGRDGARAVAVGQDYRMKTAALAHALQAAQADGRQVIAVVASACTTATGSFDAIDEIADFCAEHDLWLHVDGAHGASLALSRAHRGVLRGIERADSVVWDLHKLMALPALNTAVLFRDGRRSFEAFAQQASYLFDAAPPEEQWFNVGQRTLECTKRGMGVTAWCMLQWLGREWFEAHVDRLMASTQLLTGMLRDADDFELACEPQANIVCFRHRPAGLHAGELDRHQAALRARVLEDGAYYIVQTRLRAELWLRCTVMNPRSSAADFEGLLASLRR